LAVPWNPFAVCGLRRLLEQDQPDIMHVHNTFPLLSPAIFCAARGSKTATVLTLHNYRIFCAAAIPLRDGMPCIECMDKRSVIPALRYGCYRQSRLATIPLAIMISLHRKIGTWHKDVDAFIALTEFQKDKMIEGGLRSDRIHVKPHFYSNPPEPVPWEGRDPRIVYIGRLSREKGVHVLIEAWQRWGPEAPMLDIIGDGPERSFLEREAGRTDIRGKLTFYGQLPFPETQERLSRSRLLILPSLCFEGFPMVIREAFSLGIPVAASRIGSIPCIVTEGINGRLFVPDDPDDMYRIMRGLWTEQEGLSRMANAARTEFEEKYTAEKNYKRLMEIYEAALSVREKKNI
jgi:glycosyltransferase involved in cell wall biosynthesis